LHLPAWGQPVRRTVITTVQIDPADREPESRFSTLDSFVGTRETKFVLAPGASRKQIARTLNAAYADGLISQDTFVRRLD
jgi:hypothetical protein